MSPSYPRGFNQEAFIAQAGATYRIAVDVQSLSPFVLTLLAPAPPPNPHLDAFRRLNTGGFEFSFEVIPGRTNILEASLDLLNWDPIATNFLDCGILTVTDPDAAHYSRRFYRVRTD